MRQAINLRVVQDGYSLRGKSRWVNEAIIDLFKDPSWIDQLDADMRDGNTIHDMVSLTPEARQAIESHLPKITAEYPWRRESIGSIIRTAVTRRLFAIYMTPAPK